MGRYDKIRVYNGTDWVKPSRIRVYSNQAWQDFGEDLSANTKALSVRFEDAYHRVTLNRTEVATETDSYAGGDGFKLLPTNGFCYCPNSSSATNTTWLFRATIKKTADGDLNVFWTGKPDSSCMLHIVWLNDGRIQVTCKSVYVALGTQTITTSNAVGKDTWARLDVTCNKGSSQMSVTFNGVTTSGGMWQTWLVYNVNNKVGGNGIVFKDGMEVQGSTSSGGSTYRYINMSTASGSTSEYEGVDHYGGGTTEIKWT